MRPIDVQPSPDSHVPTMLWASGTFHNPRRLHDDGAFFVECSCGEVVEDPHLRPAITEMARHVAQPVSYVLDRVL